MSGCVRTYRIPVPVEMYPLCDELNRTAGRIYTKTLSLVRKVRRKKGFWLSLGGAQKWILRWSKNIFIHTHSKQALVQLYYQALKSYFRAVKKNPEAKPPFRRKKYMPFIWKNTAVRYEGGFLLLSLGKNREHLKVPAIFPEDTVFRQARLVYENGRYYLHLAIEVEIAAQKKNGGAVGVDLGVIKPISAVFEDGTAVVYHGGIVNAHLQYRNKRLAFFQQALSRTRQGAKRYKRLVMAKRRFLTRVHNRIQDALHKITSNFTALCVEKGISTIALGDVTGIRDRANYSRTANQKIHQWMFRKLEEMIRYKAEAVGIQVVMTPEKYTSQECPLCSFRNKPAGRNYKCSRCGFTHHRDVVGAANILRRHLSSIGAKSTVAAVLAPATGVRFHPHLCGRGGCSPWKQAVSL